MVELNKIYCGDCLELMKDIPDNSVDLILTDPPYGQENNLMRSQPGYGRTELGKRRIINDDNLEFLEPFLVESKRILKNNRWIVCFCQWRTLSEFKKAIEHLFEIKTVGVWNKGSQSLGSGMAEQYEDFILFRKGKARENFFCGNVLNFNRITGRPIHPHSKPLELFKYLIKLLSNPGNLILDPFMGSGTTAVACKKLERNFIGCEINQDYVDITNNRLAKVVAISNNIEDDDIW